MDNNKDINVWKAADIHQLRLIKAWEAAALKRHIIHGLGNISIFILLYAMLVYYMYADSHEDIPIWKPALMLLIILICIFTIWGFMIHEEQKELWGGRVYTRIVTCIGHTMIHYRRGVYYMDDGGKPRACYVDIAGDAGDIIEHVEIPTVIMESVRHQDKVLAVTSDPCSQYPMRIVPLCPPPLSRKDIL